MTALTVFSHAGERLVCGRFAAVPPGVHFCIEGALLRLFGAPEDRTNGARPFFARTAARCRVQRRCGCKSFSAVSNGINGTLNLVCVFALRGRVSLGGALVCVH